MTIGVFRSAQKALPASATPFAIDALRALSVPFVLEDTVSALFPGLEGFPREEAMRRCDVALVLGGDGSMLGMARMSAPLGLPLLGANCGRLGFLTALRLEALPEGLCRLVRGEYSVVERLMLRVCIGARETLAMNDALLRADAAVHMAHISVTVDGKPCRDFFGDGVLVATPTGSTAYSFSLGGPVVSPQLDCMLLSPVFSHNGRGLHLALHQSQIVTLTPEPSDGPMRLWVDTQDSFPVAPGQPVSVSVAPCRARFLLFDEPDFYAIVRGRLSDR